MQLRKSRIRDERGFTLIEMLISIVLIGIIAVPLASVIVGYFRNAATTSARLSESHDQQIANAYWQQDVASIGVRGAFSIATQTFPLTKSVNVSFPCATPAGSTPVVTLAWNQYDASGTPTQITVAYVTQPVGSNGQLRLVRLHCTGTTLDSTATLAHYLSAAPSLACVTGATTLSCSDAAFQTAVPDSISLTLSIRNLTDPGQPYTVTLSGQRRQT